MSDVRGYCAIAEASDPSHLASQLNDHRAAMNRAILDREGTIMQFAGDAVLAVFGAPDPRADHAQRALDAATTMQAAQAELNERWRKRGLPAFELGIGLSTGEVAAALLGSEERVEYSIVGDTVNLAHRLQAMAGRREVVLSAATFDLLPDTAGAERLPPEIVKGRRTPVFAYKLGRRARA
jgi:class 3 adenylate cyclase